MTATSLRSDPYVVRSTERAPDGRVTYTIVDMAGRVMHVTVARAATAGDGPVAVLRAALDVLPVWVPR